MALVYEDGPTELCPYLGTDPELSHLSQRLQVSTSIRELSIEDCFIQAGSER